MTKAEIIQGVLKEFRREVEGETPLRNDPDYEEMIVEALEKSLKDAELHTNIRTCEDFSHLNVECCESCHGLYQHYEMSLIDIESGGNAWICCALDRTMNPIKHAELERSSEYIAIGEMLDQIFGGKAPREDI